jgi:hypothetical protein
MKSFYAIRSLVLGVFLGSFFLPVFVLAATLAVSPTTGVYSAGATFNARVVVNTAGKPINAAEGTLKFNPQELSVVSIDRSNSIFNLWVTEPTFSNAAGTITFSGGLPSGYTGAAGTVFNVTFRTKAASTAKVSLTGGSVLANDGMGTNVLTGMSGGTYTVQAVSTTPEPEVVEYVAPANTPAAPKVTSSTHADSDAWYQSKSAALNWVLPTGITAVRTLLDKSPTTIPTKVYENPISSIELTDLDEGISYFHIQFQNADGWGKVAHYRLAVDSEKPTEFNITQAEGVDAANPIQTLALGVKDSASGVIRYMVKVDANEAYEYIDKDETRKLVLTTLEPGYHSVIIEAVDRAGNGLVSSFSFTIEAFSKPVFTEYPNEINEEVIPVLRGETRPNAAVEVFVQKIGAEPITYKLTADQLGVFTLIPEGTFTTGVYEITARASDEFGAQSELSDTIRIAVQQPGYLQIGSFIVSVLSVIIPLVAMIAILILGSWFLVLYYRRFKQKVSIESSEVLQVVTREFTNLQSILAQKQLAVSESRKTKKLTKAEEETFTELENALKGAKERVEKEVLDVEQLLRRK